MAKYEKAGAPTKYRKDFHCREFVEKSKKGSSLTQIARDWEVDRDTIYEWSKKHREFSGALKKGREYCEAWYSDLGQRAMIGKVIVDGKPAQFNLGAFVWMTKNILKWSDKVEQRNEHIAADSSTQVVVTLPQNGFETPGKKKK